MKPRFPDEYWCQTKAIELDFATVTVLCSMLNDVAFDVQKSGKFGMGEHHALMKLMIALDQHDVFKHSGNRQANVSDAVRYLIGGTK